MSQKTNPGVLEGGVTRRGFLKLGFGAGLMLLAAGAGSTVLSACKKKAAADFSVTSSVDFNHSHNVTILGADMDNPPAERVYTSDGATHTHTITLKKSDFEAIKKGQQVTVTSSAIGTTPHTHTFTIKKPAGY